jgi:NAD(P)-dependent dehydrogenase (short-subunit alcohol dehydrogenase family)
MKIAFITGSSSGIGYEALRFLHGQDFHVIGTVRTHDDKKKLLDFFPTRCSILTFDVRDINEMTIQINSVINLLEVHGLTLLINNAGIAVAGPMQYIEEDQFEMQLDVNIKSVRRITNKLLPYLGVNQKYKAGKIINISSVSGLFTSPYNGAYSVSKYGLEAMSDAYRRELAQFGIKLSIIEPGPIKTEIWSKAKGTLDQFKDTEYSSVVSVADKMIANAEKSALPVTEISKVIKKILDSDNPKTRYLVQAKPLIFKLFAHWFSDKLQDKLVAKTLGNGENHRPI